ncbi:uncharacterized protein LOC133517032 [Cydia pomonella]|uniref:uncharacterized protein LOC133517032 n=1 Tax=Cydia pomonella TaxID=82600 RepID=UPI002ADE2534|nr:uncharacterized protein LOC133517032 [Cydia pomonella]
MASVRFMVIASVLASVLADLPTQEQLSAMFIVARDACINESSKCQIFCRFKNYGLLDKDGRYVESEAVKAMSIMVHDGILNQEQLNKIAKTCNSVNENIKTGCERGLQVYQCIDDERFKITGKRH